MSSPPVIPYFSPMRLPWRQRPWNRWVKIGVACTLLAAASEALLLMCSAYWLVRPAMVESIRLGSLALLLAAFVFNATALVSSSRQRGAQRGFVLALLMFLATFPSCFFFLMLCGPAAEVPQFRFDYATREHQFKIAKILQAYAETHAAYPPHLAVLVANGKLAPSDLLDPFSNTRPLVIPAGLGAGDWRRIVAAVDAHCDFIYTAGDLPLNYVAADSEKLIVLYDKGVPGRDGRLVRRGWGYEEIFVKLADLPAEFAAHNAARAAIGLPPQTLDVQPAVPPTVH